MTRKRFRGLFFNAVFVLALISLVPVVLIGFHVVRVNSDMLQREILQRQQTVASRLASVAQSYITHTTQLFSVFTDLHTDFGGHDFLNREDLEYLLKRDPSLRYLAVLSPSGGLLFSSGKLGAAAQYKQALPAIVQTSGRGGAVYWGRVSRLGNNSLAVLMAFPLRQRLSSTQIEGILVAEMNLQEMGLSLAQAYPLEMEAFVLSADGDLISYNGAPDGLALAPEEPLLSQVQQVRNQLGAAPSGEVSLQSGVTWLAAAADILPPGWKVYVAQPANVASKLFVGSIFQASWSLVFILAAMVLFVVGVSYLVIIPISRPLERLRKAAWHLQAEEGAIIRREEVAIPHNEIGDLAEVLVEMSEVLHARREELLKAQRQLALANQDLEQRVEERTRELKEASGELVKAERLAAIGQMASIISHEIRNPLAVISNATRLIKLLLRTPEPKLAKQIGIIEAEIKQANSIISEVLGYARTRELILSTVDLNSYLHDLLALCTIPPGVELVSALDEEPARIKVDAEEIKQAVRNVITNALEAMPNGGTLTVGTRVGRKLVCIYVADTGPGISEEIRKKMFAPFFTTKARGTGLGLAVVGKAIARHKGKLFISSRPGQGTCFQIYLRIYKKPGDTNYGEAS